MRPSLAITLALGITLAAGAAQAQGVRSDYSQEGGTHVFDDEDLLGAGIGPLGALLRVRPPPGRVMLLRPRTSWVPEMLKSVENM